MDQKFLVFIIPLLTGYLLDLLLGDPIWLPHPIRLFGKLISIGEKELNKGDFKFFKGLLLTLILCLTVFFLFKTFIDHLYKSNVYVYHFLSSIFVFYALANKSLLQEGKEVFDSLHNKGIEAGRKRLTWIVGRETKNLSENRIRIAVLETVSENLSDGVIAPLFYYGLAGLPGMMTYKMINTLDSMIGYKNDKFFYFGRFAARLDDVANYIPSRITAVLIALVSLSARSFLYIFKYGHKHASPNSGYPEAALAGVLNCRFGGPNVYHGKVVEKPYIGKTPRDIEHQEFSKVASINLKVTFLTVMIIAMIYYIIFTVF